MGASFSSNWKEPIGVKWVYKTKYKPDDIVRMIIALAAQKRWKIH